MTVRELSDNMGADEFNGWVEYYDLIEQEKEKQEEARRKELDRLKRNGGL